MREITAEGIKFYYFTANEGLPDQLPDDFKLREQPLLKSLWDELLSKHLQDMRLILFTWMWQKVTFDFVYWDDSSDLTVLDEKVVNGTYTDADFEHAVITRFGRTFCRYCDWKGYTLVMFTAEHYVLKPDLELKKMREHTFKNCPECGKRLSQMVAKIF